MKRMLCRYWIHHRRRLHHLHHWNEKRNGWIYPHRDRVKKIIVRDLSRMFVDLDIAMIRRKCHRRVGLVVVVVDEMNFCFLIEYCGFVVVPTVAVMLDCFLNRQYGRDCYFFC